MTFGYSWWAVAGRRTCLCAHEVTALQLVHAPLVRISRCGVGDEAGVPPAGTCVAAYDLSLDLALLHTFNVVMCALSAALARSGASVHE